MEPEEAKTIVGRNVRRLRESRGLTQEDLAHLAGLHPPGIGRLERGAVDPRASTLVRVANALGVAVADLLVSADA